MLNASVKYTAYAVLGLYSLLLFLFGVSVPSLMTRILSFVPMLLVICFAGFDRWAWRWPIVLKFVKRPYLAGTWWGELISYRLDEDNRKTSSTHDVVLVIQQTFTTISLTLMTAESKSRSVAPEIEKEANDDFVVHYQYENTPHLAVRETSPIHRGSAAIEVHGSSPVDLDAEYWTARKSQGTFALKKITNKRVGSFREGQTLATIESEVE